MTSVTPSRVLFYNIKYVSQHHTFDLQSIFKVVANNWQNKTTASKIIKLWRLPCRNVFLDIITRVSFYNNSKSIWKIPKAFCPGNQDDANFWVGPQKDVIWCRSAKGQWIYLSFFTIKNSYLHNVQVAMWSRNGKILIIATLTSILLNWSTLTTAF